MSKHAANYLASLVVPDPASESLASSSEESGLHSRGMSSSAEELSDDDSADEEEDDGP